MIIFNKIEKILIYKHRQRVVVDNIIFNEKNKCERQYELNKLSDKIDNLSRK